MKGKFLTYCIEIYLNLLLLQQNFKQSTLFLFSAYKWYHLESKYKSTSPNFLKKLALFWKQS